MQIRNAIQTDMCILMSRILSAGLDGGDPSSAGLEAEKARLEGEIRTCLPALHRAREDGTIAIRP